jgi:hypothetical protein
MKKARESLPQRCKLDQKRGVTQSVLRHISIYKSNFGGKVAMSAVLRFR